MNKQSEKRPNTDSTGFMFSVISENYLKLTEKSCSLSNSSKQFTDWLKGIQSAQEWVQDWLSRKTQKSQTSDIIACSVCTLVCRKSDSRNFDTRIDPELILITEKINVLQTVASLEIPGHLCKFWGALKIMFSEPTESLLKLGYKTNLYFFHEGLILFL